MTNLLKETKEILESHGKSLKDVAWIGSREHEISVVAFIKLADTEYDSGFGSPEVAENLLIVGDGFWLERHEYDGSEWWEFKESPARPKKKIDPKALTIEQANAAGFDVSCGWEDLEGLNGIKKA